MLSELFDKGIARDMGHFYIADINIDKILQSYLKGLFGLVAHNTGDIFQFVLQTNHFREAIDLVLGIVHKEHAWEIAVFIGFLTETDSGRRHFGRLPVKDECVTGLVA